MSLRTDRLSGITYEESAGRVNRIEISGWLMDDVTPDETDSGSKYLRTRLHIQQGMPYFLVKLWLNDGIDEEVLVEAMTKIKGQSVVVTGKFSAWSMYGKTHISIDAESII
jgi:hypothetical protein